MTNININKKSPNYIILQSVFGTNIVTENELIDFFTAPIIDVSTTEMLIDMFIENKGVKKVADIYFYNKRTLYRYVSKVLVALKEDYEKKQELAKKQRNSSLNCIEESSKKCYNKGELEL